MDDLKGAIDDCELCDLGFNGCNSRRRREIALLHLCKNAIVHF